MEKYRRVPGPKEEGTTDPTVVRVQVHGKIVTYVAVASQILEGKDEAATAPKVTIIGRGRAINKAVTVSEVLRRKLSLHQVTSLSSVTITDHYEPLEEGLDPIENTRVVSCITIELATSAESLDKEAPGYSAPLASDETHLTTDAMCAAMDAADRAAASRGGRGRGRGGRARAPRGGRGASRANGHGSRPESGKQGQAKGAERGSGSAVAPVAAASEGSTTPAASSTAQPSSAKA